MSWNKKLGLSVPRRNKTINSQILTKTQVVKKHLIQALEAIRTYEARNDKLKNRNKLQNPVQIINKLDQDYSRLHFSKEMSVDRIERIQLFPYNQAYFSIDISMMMFPIRVFVKNVRNEGTLYVGYDKQFPGISGSKGSKNSTPRMQSLPSEEEEKNYNYKFKFTRDVMFVLKNQSKKYVSKIFLNFSAHSELLMFNVKFDCVGYQGMDELKTRKRIMTEQKLISESDGRETFYLPPTHQKSQLIKESPRVMRATSKTRINSKSRANIQLDLLVRSNTEMIPEIRGKICDNKEQKSFYKDEGKEKDFLHMNLLNLERYRKDASTQRKQEKKQKFNETVLRIKVNKEQVNELKQKEREVNETAKRFKKMIEAYEKSYKGNLVRNRKIVHVLAPLLFASIFQKKGCILYEKEAKHLSSAFVIRYFIIKFTSRIQKKYKQHQAIVPRLKDRTHLNIFHFLTMESKSLNQKNIYSAASVILSNFQEIKPGILINLALNKASSYRRSVRVIQRRWKTKYDARLEMLQIFVEAHVQKMINQFPHLKLGLSNFRQGKHRVKICYEYMADESIKFRHIYQSYLGRLKEIQEYIKENNRIRQLNKGKPQKKWKKYLEVPKKPLPPQHRIFRNLDILKSMLRGWFQLEYKKCLKRNTSFG